MKKNYLLIIIFLIISIIIWNNQPKLFNYYVQLTKSRIGLSVDLQSVSQKNSNFVGSEKCKECHSETHDAWNSSLHSKMIQNIKSNPAVVVADFTKLPDDADFTLSESIFTVGSKFKQRYMLLKDINGSIDYILGNYQWNIETQEWQKFAPWKYWYKEAYTNNNKGLPTSRACDGCHFVGYMSRGQRIESSIGCESCHGPGSEHVINSDLPIFNPSAYDPIRTNEVCLQCHMRNRDKRLEKYSMTMLMGKAVDYPKGYEPGRPLINYKLIAPFYPGQETKEFWANGAAKKNRSQGNEYINDVMYKHGITCINCHNPHTLTNTAQNSIGNDACLTCHSFGSIIGPHQNTLEQHTHHKANSKGSLCIECHMPRTAKHTKKSPLTVRSHVFKFTTPAQTKAYAMPAQTNACYACHNNKSLDELQNNLFEWGMVGWDSLGKYK